MNEYVVEAAFEKSRLFYRSEYWQGTARNMAIAIRKATLDIMRRKNVKRLQHHQVTFRIEKITPALRASAKKEIH